jgi:hypothetical protein
MMKRLEASLLASGVTLTRAENQLMGFLHRKELRGVREPEINPTLV